MLYFLQLYRPHIGHDRLAVLQRMILSTAWHDVNSTPLSRTFRAGRTGIIFAAIRVPLIGNALPGYGCQLIGKIVAAPVWVIACTVPSHIDNPLVLIHMVRSFPIPTFPPDPAASPAAYRTVKRGKPQHREWKRNLIIHHQIQCLSILPHRGTKHTDMGYVCGITVRQRSAPGIERCRQQRPHSG